MRDTDNEALEAIDSADPSANGIIIRLTVPFFDTLSWRSFAETLGQTLKDVAQKEGAEALDQPVGRGPKGLAMAVSYGGDDPGVMSFFTEPIDPHSPEGRVAMSHLTEISMNSGFGNW